MLRGLGHVQTVVACGVGGAGGVLVGSAGYVGGDVVDLVVGAVALRGREEFRSARSPWCSARRVRVMPFMVGRQDRDLATWLAGPHQTGSGSRGTGSVEGSPAPGLSNGHSS
jgi:hypothetical protein